MFTATGLAITGLLFGVYCWLVKDHRSRVVAMRRLALASVVLLGGFWLMFAAGEALDSRKTTSVVWTVVIAVPVLILLVSSFAFFRSDWFGLLGILLVAVELPLLIYVMFINKNFINTYGPVLALWATMVAIPIGFMGLHRPRLAWILLSIAAFMGAVGSPPRSGEALASPIVIAVFWLLLSDLNSAKDRELNHHSSTVLT